MTPPTLAVEPIGVELANSSQRLRLTWSDGHESAYPLAYVRGYCPCAVCQGHSTGWRFVANDGPAVVDALEVGRYALNLVFADGHRTGIYSYELLRHLCPCADCQTQGGPQHPWRRLPPLARQLHEG